MAGYLGTKAAFLSTTAASVTGNATIGGDLTVGSNALFVDESTGDISFYEDTGTTPKFFWDASAESLGIGTSSLVSYPKITVYDASTKNAGLVLQNTTTGQTSNDGLFVGLGVGGSGDAETAYIYHREAGPLVFATSNSEAMRIDSSGNLLVGTTDNNVADNSGTSNSGFNVRSSGRVLIAEPQNAGLWVNRLGDDGDIAVFRKDGSTVGSISTLGGDLAIGSPTGSGAGLRMAGSSNVIYASNASGNARDNVIDLGASIVRFDDIYATNGTIQTSDRNEKQDIEALSDAEQRVAVACKGLLRKFRWKDAVAKKGDDARIHFGIIAQDLQDAFTAEGLDAGRYAMFISTTWWETQTDVPAVEAVEAVYEDVVIPAVLDEDGNEVEPERTEQQLVTEAVEAKDAYTRTDTYETLEEAPEGATERTRMGVRYPELLAFIIGAM